MGNERKNVLEYLPQKIASEIKNKVPDIEQILEIRIRVNKPICVRTIKKEYVIDEIKIENTDMNGNLHNYGILYIRIWKFIKKGLLP